MSRQSIADLLAATLASAGVERIWGVTGDSLNALNESLRKSGKPQWMMVRHEEVAAFAAGAEAAITGELAVCAGSCGPGNLHLINGLFDCQRNHVPVLAIAAHIPSSEVGLGYFQETHPQELFRECSDFCELVSNPAQMPEILNRAMRTAIGKQGVAVLVIPGDVAMQAVPDGRNPTWPKLEAPRLLPAHADLDRLVGLLQNEPAVTLLCGSGCAGAHDEVVQLADLLAAPVVHALRGKEYVEWDNPFDVGMTGLIGFSSGYHAMMNCDLLLMLGTDFPYRHFYPAKAKVVQVDHDPGAKRTFLASARDHYHKAREDLDHFAKPAGAGRPVHPQYLARLIDEIASDDAIIASYVGTPTVWAARYLTTNGKRRLLFSANHGSMANALPQAIGAQAAEPARQVVTMSGDGGLAMLLGDLLTLKQLDLPVKVVVFDNQILGFVAMEQKAGGFLPVNTALENPDFAVIAQASGILGIRVDDSMTLEEALRRAFAHEGPALVQVRIATQELAMPPKVELEQVKGFSLYALKAILNGRGDELVELATTNLR